MTTPGTRVLDCASLAGTVDFRAHPKPVLTFRRRLWRSCGNIASNATRDALGSKLSRPVGIWGCATPVPGVGTPGCPRAVPAGTEKFAAIQISPLRGIFLHSTGSVEEPLCSWLLATMSDRWQINLATSAYFPIRVIRAIRGQKGEQPRIPQNSPDHSSERTPSSQPRFSPFIGSMNCFNRGWSLWRTGEAESQRLHRRAEFGRPVILQYDEAAPSRCLSR